MVFSALHQHFHGFGAIEDFKRSSSAWHSVKMLNVKDGPGKFHREAQRGSNPLHFPPNFVSSVSLW